MASKRRQRAKQCTGKVAYKSYGEAGQHLWGGMHAYGCRFCGLIHIGHPPGNVKIGLAQKRRNREP